MLISIKPDESIGKVLDESLDRVKRLYQETIQLKKLVPDVVAKGPDFVGALKQELEAKYPPRNKTQNLFTNQEKVNGQQDR
jgi:hypothetical protein